MTCKNSGLIIGVITIVLYIMVAYFSKKWWMLLLGVSIAVGVFFALRKWPIKSSAVDFLAKISRDKNMGPLSQRPPLDNQPHQVESEILPAVILLYDIDGTSVDRRTSEAMIFARRLGCLQGLNTNTIRYAGFSIERYGRTFGVKGQGFQYLYEDMLNHPVLFNNNYFHPHQSSRCRGGPQQKLCSMNRVREQFPDARIILLDDLSENVEIAQENGFEAKQIFDYVTVSDIKSIL